jgi:hypothetical protein
MGMILFQVYPQVTWLSRAAEVNLGVTTSKQ